MDGLDEHDGQAEASSGTLLGGRFAAKRAVGELLGAQLWSGTDCQSGSPVLLYLVPASQGPQGAAKAMERNRRLVSELTTSPLIAALAAGQQGEQVYLALPISEQDSLSERLERGPLSLEEALNVGIDLLEALGALHGRGLLHQELRPDAVRVEPGPAIRHARLLDLGLARERLLDFSSEDLPLDVVRSLSPEQLGVIHARVGPPADLYAAGTVLFHCLTGRPAFDGRSLGELLQQQLSLVPALRAAGVAVPPALEEVVERLLRKDPTDRYQSAAAAAVDLRALRAALVDGGEAEVLVGAEDLRQSLTAPSLVDRFDELAELERGLQATIDGQGSVFLIEGSSGSGKTRFLEEIARRAGAYGMRVLQSSTPPSGPPHLSATLAGLIPVLLREEASGAGALCSLGEEDRAALAQAIPELAPVLHGPPAEIAPALIAERIQRALASLLQRLGRPDLPCAILLDDCQWADEQLQRLVESWSRSPPTRSYTFLVVSFRSEEVGPEHPLRRAAERGHRLELTALPERHLRFLLRSMAGELPPEVDQAVLRLSEGNPFWAIELMRGLVESGILYPTSAGWRADPSRLEHAAASQRAAALLVERLERLPPETRDLLAAAAVLGREFSVQAAAELAGLDEGRARRALELGVERHLLWRAEQGQQAFVHDRVREQTLAELSLAQRRVLHLRAAERLQRLRPEAVFEIARHLDQAGESVRARPFALRAADQALRRYALDAATGYYRMALRSAQALPAPERLQVLEGLGRTLMLRGHYDEAERWLCSAQRLGVDGRDRARLLSLLGELAFKQGEMQKALDLLENAARSLNAPVPTTRIGWGMALLREILIQTAHSFLPSRPRASERKEDDLLLARIYSRLAYTHWFQAGRVSTLCVHLRGLNLAERHPSSPELAQAYSEHAPALTLLSWYSRAVRYAQRSLELRRELQDAWGEGQSLHFLGIALHAAGRLEEARDTFRGAVELLERTGDRWEANTARTGLALSLYRLGRLGPAVEEARRVHAEAGELDAINTLRFSLCVWSQASLGLVPSDQVRLELERPPRDPHSQVEALEAAGIHQLRLKDPQSAEGHLSEAARLIRRYHLDQEYTVPVFAWRVTALRLQAEGCPLLAPHRRQGLLRRASRAARVARLKALRFPNNLPHALRESGLVLALRGKPRRARRHLARALELARRKGMTDEVLQSEVALTRLEAAGDGLETNRDHERAEAALKQHRQVLSPPEEEEPAPTPGLAERFPRVLESGHRIATALTRERVFSELRRSLVQVLWTEDIQVFPEAGPFESGPYTRALELAVIRREPVILQAEELSLDGWYGGSEPRQVLAAPVLVRGKPVAAFCASHRAVTFAFGPNESRLAAYLSTLAGAALENAENFSKLQALSDERARLFDQAQEALRLREEFLTVAAHEFKTPLTVLGLQLRRLESRVEEGTQSPLASAFRQVRKLSQMVDEQLDLITLEGAQLRLSPEPADLGELLRTAVEGLRAQLEQSGTEVVLDLQPTAGEWDRRRVVQILSSLLSNAVKYGPGQPVRVRLRAEGGWAELSVTDQGIGIAPEDQERIFERFARAVSTRHYGGFGLGLWLSRRLAEAMGGELQVESRLEEGATFILRLPLTPTTKSAPPAGRGPPGPGRAK